VIVAGTIAYEKVGALPGIEIPSSVIAEGMRIQTLDMTVLTAALMRPRHAAQSGDILVIIVHGSSSAWDQEPNISCATGLAKAGFSTLAINTRQSGAGGNRDSFHTIVHDIDAAVVVARSLGFRFIFIQGHSLGNVQVTYYAATHWEKDIKGIILLAPFADLPWKSRHILIADEEKYQELSQASRESLRVGREAELLPILMPGPGGAKLQVTGQHFLTYRSTAASAATGAFWISKVPRPILIVRDAGDSIVLAFEPQVLAAAALSGDSLCPNVENVTIPNGLPANPGGHSFSGTTDELVSTLANWLSRQLADSELSDVAPTMA
jgi:pimeloyl-ACP methyl ester carboxylesterase